MNGKSKLTPYTDMDLESGATLMDLVKSGDMAAFGRLYQKYGELVNHAIISTAPELDRSEVEDLCQDIFLSIKKNVSRYNEEGKAKAWIYRYAVLTTKGRRRKWAIRNRIMGMFTGHRIAISNTQQASPEVGVLLHTDVEAILKKLPLVQRQVLILFEKDGMRGDEIATLLDMNVNTVWTHLRRARATVNEIVKKTESNSEHITPKKLDTKFGAK